MLLSSWHTVSSHSCGVTAYYADRRLRLITSYTAMSPFKSIEDAAEFVKQSPLAGDTFELPMADGYTLHGRPARPMGKFSLGMAGIVALLVERDFEPTGTDKQQGFTTFKFSRMRMSSGADVPFPADFTPRRIRLPNARELAEQLPVEIVKYFEAHPEAATDVIRESEDKRFSPSTFIEVRSSSYRVGWFGDSGMQCVQTFSARADAVTDYLLFSFGKGRWKGRPAAV